MTKNKMKSVAHEVYAVWVISAKDFNKAVWNDEDSGAYVSCGVGDDQYEGYFPGEEGGQITTRPVDGSLKEYEVIFTAPSMGLEKKKGYWLSPSCLGPDEIEASDFGIRPIEG